MCEIKESIFINNVWVALSSSLILNSERALNLVRGERDPEEVLIAQSQKLSEVMINGSRDLFTTFPLLSSTIISPEQTPSNSAIAAFFR